MPTGAIAIPVTAGSTSTGKNAALAPAGAISGTVTAATGGGALAGVHVQAFASNGGYAGSATTNASGLYAVVGLATSSAGYFVCFYGSAASGGSTTGYLAQCYNNVAWDGGSVPTGATAIPVTAGATSSGKNAALAPAGAISGTVTAASGGGALAGVEVLVTDSSGNLIANETTDANGHYAAIALKPSTTGYFVCFSSSSYTTGGSSTTGYLDQCYNNVAWDGRSTPTGLTAIPVTSGATAGGKNAALKTAGAISGTVTAATGGSPLTGVSVEVLDTAGNYLSYASTDANGQYEAVGLATSASGYYVCFDPSYATGGSAPNGYLDQCYNNVAWDGSTVPTAAAKVPVTTGATSSGKNAALVSGGGISGTVTAAGGSQALPNVNVDVIDSNGNYIAYATTDSSGNYSVDRLNASTAGYSVCFDTSNMYTTVAYLDQCYDGIPWDGSTDPTGSVTPVPVTLGTTSGGVGAALQTGGAISGTVTAATGGEPLAGVTVDVINSGGNYLGSASTSANGHYTVAGLPSSATGYSVCFDASGASGGSSTTGYVDQCYSGAPWNGRYYPPAEATPVPVTVGTTVTGIDAVLATGGAVTGTVTAAMGGGPLAGVSIDFIDQTGGYVGFASTDASGHYTALGLASSTTGYSVCFDASVAAGGGSITGYADQCYNNTAWDGVSTPSASTTAVPVAAAQLRRARMPRLITGGAIIGSVTAAAGGALANVDVAIIGSDGTFLRSTNTDSNGQYTVSGLAASADYSVCFDATYAVGGTSTTGYVDQCYNNVWWSGSGDPQNATPVAVTSGAETSGISAALAAGATISGTVTAASGGGSLSGVWVYVYVPSGNRVGYVQTDANGNYQIKDLAASTTGYSVCFDASVAVGGSSTGGYLDQCYNNVAWDGVSAPTGTTPVPVAAGATASGTNAALISAGAISGKVTAATGGGNLDGVWVYVYDASGNNIASTTTNYFGRYVVRGLTASATGYSVCFGASTYVTGGGSTTGYLDQCYKNVAWDGFSTPSGTTRIPVAAGTTASGKNAALTSAGAIAGTVTAATGGAPLTSVQVDVIDGAGSYVGSATTDANGNYEVVGLAPSTTGYSVCFDASFASGGTSTTGYADQCYNNVPWDGFSLPSGATAVPVTAGSVSAGKDAALANG